MERLSGIQPPVLGDGHELVEHYPESIRRSVACSGAHQFLVRLRKRLTRRVSRPEAPMRCHRP